MGRGDLKLADQRHDPSQAGHSGSCSFGSQKQAPLTIHEMSGGLQMGTWRY